MRIRAARIRSGPHAFALVLVEPEVLSDPLAADATAQLYVRLFPGEPILLVAEDVGRRAGFYGRRDIVELARRMALSEVPWRDYQVEEVL